MDDSPDTGKVSTPQARHLARLAKMNIEEITALSRPDLMKRLEFQINPALFGYRRICGKVVRIDPETGEECPVPFATVEVEDTDCHFHIYTPPGYPWCWLYPLHCDREVIATATTDECGEFCVWVPRWDVDRILSWRKGRICYPILEPICIKDLFDDLPWIDPERPPLPPRPDPVPEVLHHELLDAVQDRLPPALAERMLRTAPLGHKDSKKRWKTLLESPVPKSALPLPPAPDPEDIERLGAKFPLRPTRKVLGPFKWWCRDIYIPVWTTYFDVPDITFKVTQKREDGTEVVVYSEGFFDVRWNDDESNVVLEAGPDAICSEECGPPPSVECEDVPAIDFASLMGLTPGYHDDATGYGLRVNGPSIDDRTAPPVGSPSTAGPAEAPYADTLSLFGCYHIDDATHYRLVRSFEGGADQPVTGVNFTVWRADLSSFPQIPDADGWYQIHSNLHSIYEHLIMPWPTARSAFPDGTYDVWVEVGTASGGTITPTAASAKRRFEVDNSYPVATFNEISWWVAGSPGSATVLPAVCPIINRPTGQEIVVQVQWSASSAHLRSGSCSLTGCGGGVPVTTLSTADTVAWWWRTPGATSTGIKTAQFTIPANAPAGCYTARLNAVTRAYNPAVPMADPSDDWYVLDDRRPRRPSRAISVVDV